MVSFFAKGAALVRARRTSSARNAVVAQAVAADAIADSEPDKEQRRSRRQPIARPALLAVGDLTIHGVLQDVSDGGGFLSTRLLIEVGERGVLTVDGTAIGVEVVWLRGNAEESGPGMGLVFEGPAAERERFRRRFAPRKR